MVQTSANDYLKKKKKKKKNCLDHAGVKATD